MEVLTSIALSLHLGFAGDYNAFHPHVRLQEQQYIAGVYYNSEYTISPYVGYRFEHDDIGLELGRREGSSEERQRLQQQAHATASAAREP